MKPRKLLLASGVIIALAGASIILVAGRNWWLGIANPPPVILSTQSTNWSPPIDTVPLEGIEPPLPRDQAAKSLQNPQPASPSSIESGRQIYITYCAVCHGNEARGDGPIANKLVFPPPELPHRSAGLTDGYLYATTRNGGFIMPPYGYRISPGERWDLVNYLRNLQKRGASSPSHE